VKFLERAYWHCQWVPEHFLKDNYRIKLRNFLQKEVSRDSKLARVNRKLGKTGACSQVGLVSRSRAQRT
jgi:hypothetical protein